MHELALARDVLNKVLAEAEAKNISKPTYAKIQIGETRITHRQEFEELFAMVSKGIPVEGIKLEINISPLKSACKNCGHEFAPGKMDFKCAHCGSKDIQITSGQELLVLEML